MRVTVPKIALLLYPWFVPANQTRQEIYLELRDRLKNESDKTFCVVAVDMAKERIYGFLVAYCRENDVYIWQARTHTVFDNNYPDHEDTLKCNNIAFDMLFDWARQKNYARVSVDSPNSSRYLVRRYGFCRKSKDDTEITKEI